MIMENIIIHVLALCYYVFCIIAAVTYIQAPRKYKFLEGLGLVLLVMIISPIGVPIGLGIIVGEKAKKL